MLTAMWFQLYQSYNYGYNNEINFGSNHMAIGYGCDYEIPKIIGNLSASFLIICPHGSTIQSRPVESEFESLKTRQLRLAFRTVQS